MLGAPGLASGVGSGRSPLPAWRRQPTWFLATRGCGPFPLPTHSHRPVGSALLVCQALLCSELCPARGFPRPAPSWGLRPELSSPQEPVHLPGFPYTPSRPCPPPLPLSPLHPIASVLSCFLHPPPVPRAGWGLSQSPWHSRQAGVSLHHA